MEAKDSVVNVNFAYKCVPAEGGVAFLFEEIDYDGLKTPIMNHSGADVFLQYGRNVMLLTPDVMDKLIASPRIIFIESKFDDYLAGGIVGSVDVDPMFLARVSGALSVFATPGQ